MPEGRAGDRPALEPAGGLHAAAALLSRVAGRALDELDVTWPQAMSLLLLAECDTPVNATWLVHELGLGRTAMTAVVDRLEARGWLSRRPHARDRRVAELALTESGRSLAARVARATSEALAPLQPVLLPAEDLALLTAALEQGG